MGKTNNEYIEKAKELYAIPGELDVDDDAEVSVTEDGAWVAAWVFIGNEDFDSTDNPS